MEEAKQLLINNINSKNVLVALSGGPDSILVLKLLIELKEQLDINIVCLHVNHNLRKESVEEAKLLKNLCETQQLIFEEKVIKSYKNNKFTEAEARNERYKFFDEMIEKYNSTILVTGHHNDDLLETIIMRLVRGSTLKGYSGIEGKKKRKSYIILRPLLTLTKDEILTYLDNNNVKYFNDYTNEEDTYLRNRIRKMIKGLKKENSNLSKQVLKYSLELKKADDYIEKATIKEFHRVFDNYIDLNKFKDLDDYIQERVLRYYLSLVYGEEQEVLISNNLIEIKKVISSQKPNIKSDLPLNKKVIKEYNKLYISDPSIIKNYKMLLKKDLILPNGYQITETEEEGTNNYYCYLSRDDIKLPLYVRNYSNEDKIEVLGMNGSKKVKDIFINEKIGLSERESWPVLIDGDNKILWVPGLKKSKYDGIKTKRYDIILKYFKEKEKIWKEK